MGVPSGAEARVYFVLVAARLKSCPVTKPSYPVLERVFPQPVKPLPRCGFWERLGCGCRLQEFASGAEAHVYFVLVAARLKSCPDTKPWCVAAGVAGYWPTSLSLYMYLMADL
jgi:hypothetical protein